MSVTVGGLSEARASVAPRLAPVHHIRDGAGVPHYLKHYYWWAYIHPRAVKLFERQWLINLILCGNYVRLRDAVLAEWGDRLPGRTLQVACVYGDLTARLCERVTAGGGSLDVIDVLPIQLDNLRRKLPDDAPVHLSRMDSTALAVPTARYDRAFVFFLLHEQPSHDRERTIREVVRVVRPGGSIVIVDYAMPRRWHPLRYLWRPLLAVLEPFALDLWRRDIAEWLPGSGAIRSLRRQTFFGGLYQKIVAIRGAGPA